MSVLYGSLKTLCGRNGFLNYAIEQATSSLYITQVRFKSKRNKELKPPKEKKTFVRPIKRNPEDEAKHQIYSTPSTDDVWIHKYFPTYSVSFLEAIRRHRELASPEMTSNMEGSIVLEADLDLRSKKKTKYLGAPEGLLLLPHNFDIFFPGRVVAITKCEEEQKKALAAGAVYAGGVDLIRKIEKGDIRQEDFDHVVLSDNLLVEAAVIKKVVKDMFPSKKNGNLGSDIERMVKLFTFGKEYKGTKVLDAVGKLVFPIGKLNMTDEQLFENMKTILSTILEQAETSRTQNYFAKLKLTCPPSEEVFIIKDESIMPATLAKKKSKIEIVDEEEDKELTAAA